MSLYIVKENKVMQILVFIIKKYTYSIKNCILNKAKAFKGHQYNTEYKFTLGVFVNIH